MKVSMPTGVGDNEDDGDDDDDDDDLIAKDLMSLPPISDIKEAFVASGSDDDTPTAVEGDNSDNFNNNFLLRIFTSPYSHLIPTLSSA